MPQIVEIIFLSKTFTSAQKTQAIKKKKKKKKNVKIAKTMKIKVAKNKFMQSINQTFSFKNTFDNIHFNIKDVDFEILYKLF